MKLLNPEQVSEFLQVKLSTIYQWTHQDFIPHVKLGRLVRFDEEEIVKWLSQRREQGRVSRALEI